MKLKVRNTFFLILIFSSFQGAFAEPVKVGAILPLTGPVAEYGQAIVNSINFAREDHPELFENLTFGGWSL